MIYRFGITTEYTYKEINKKTTVLKLGEGIIHQIDIVFPAGLAGTTHMQITRGLHQVWPTNPDEDFAGDNDKISFHEHYELDEEPYQLEVHTWNTSTEHDHLIIVRIGLLRKKFVLRRLF